MARNTHHPSSSQPLSRYQTTPSLPPVYCISRPNGSYTPLIPADQIPPEIPIPCNYPRIISSEVEAMQWNLQCLGEYNESQCQDTTPSVAPPPSMVLQKAQDFKNAKGNVVQQSVVNYDSRVRRPLPPSGIEPDLRKKEFCQFWIRHGQCDFMQQGCLYKHEMPPLSVLKDIMGLSTFPRWWVEERMDTESGSVQPKRTNVKAQRSIPVRPRNLAAIGSEREAGTLTAGGLQTSKYAQNSGNGKADQGSVHLIDLDDHQTAMRSSAPSNHSQVFGSPSARKSNGQLINRNSCDNVTDKTIVQRFVAHGHSAQSCVSRGEMEIINEVQRARAMKEARFCSPELEEAGANGVSYYSQKHPTDTLQGKGRRTRRGRKFSTTSRSSPSEVSTDKIST